MDRQKVYLYGMELNNLHIDLDVEIVARAKAKYEYHTLNAGIYHDILVRLGVFNEQKNGNDVKRIVTKDDVVLQEVTRSPFGKGFTFVDWVEKLLASDGRPRLTQEIKDEYFKETGHEIEFKNFSSKLATRADRTGRIRNVKYDELPLHRRHWWGLRAWFKADGDLRQEYKARISDLQEKTA